MKMPVLKINSTAAQLEQLESSLKRIPMPPGWVAVPFPFDTLPTNDDQTPIFESDATKNELNGVHLLADGTLVGTGILRAIQLPRAAIWDLMLEPYLRFNGESFYVWVDPTRGQFTKEPLVVNNTLPTATLLMQTLITPGDKTVEGVLIEAVATPWLEIVRLLKNDPNLAFQISPRKWEEIVAGAYKAAKFDEVILTPSSGDFGRDVIAIKRGIGSIRVIDQVKAYKPGHFVTADDVRALLGVVFADKASKGFLTTTSDFAPKLRDDILLKPHFLNSLELINGPALLKRLEELGNSEGMKRFGIK
jgi:restriction system protein